MEELSYFTVDTILNTIDQNAFAQLLISEHEASEYVQPGDKTNDLRSEVEALVSHNLRDRNVNWRLILENLTSLLQEAGTLEDVFILACREGLLEEVSILLEAEVDPSSCDNAALILATRRDRVDVVQLLLSSPRVDPTARDNAAYKIANRDGFYYLVEVLRSDSRVDALIT